MSRGAEGLGTRIAAVARWKATAESRAVGMTSWGSPMSKAKTDTAATPDLPRGAPLLSDVLPLPAPRFRGLIGSTYADSEADVISVPSPPAGAPNVVVVLLDDVGFGQAGTFGGPADTPTLQRLAEDGLRYNRFHTTALCSPTRAALLSGRNHHSVHTGVITEMATGFPGYDGSWPREAACIAEVLKGNQYSTAAFGKWHNTPDHELGAPGPFDRWPVGKGFDYFFGFQGGESSQWHTPLYENTAPVEPPHDDPTWHFSEAIAEKAIGWMSQQKAAAPDKPFFIYFAPGAVSLTPPCRKRVGRQVPGDVRPRLGPATRDDPREAEEARRGAEGHQADAA